MYSFKCFVECDFWTNQIWIKDKQLTRKPTSLLPKQSNETSPAVNAKGIIQTLTRKGEWIMSLPQIKIWPNTLKNSAKTGAHQTGT